MVSMLLSLRGIQYQWSFFFKHWGHHWRRCILASWGIILWMHFPHYWSFVRESQWPLMVSFDVFFDRSELLYKQSSCRFFEMPWWSCDFTALILSHDELHLLVFLHFQPWMQQVTPNPSPSIWILNSCQNTWILSRYDLVAPKVI